MHGGVQPIVGRAAFRKFVERFEHVVPICAVFEIRDGRIIAWHEYFDPALFAHS